jgi:hypothetical protein
MCVIKKPRELGGHSPRWAAEPEIIIKIAITIIIIVTSRTVDNLNGKRDNENSHLI